MNLFGNLKSKFGRNPATAPPQSIDEQMNASCPIPAPIPVPPPQTQLKLFRVQIMADGPGHVYIEKKVFALSEKQALQAVIESMPENDPEWQWPGWRVQVYQHREAFIISGKRESCGC